MLDLTPSQKRERPFLKYFGVFSLLCALVYLLYGPVFINSSESENRKFIDSFYKRSPDLIVVFTGASGRIPYALKLAKKFKQNQIFISGVYSKNSIQSLIIPLKNRTGIDVNYLELDYQARNTVENILSTLQYLRKNKNFQNILIVSHDYHIMRIKTLMNALKRENDPFLFYYSGVGTDYSKLSSIALLYKEIFKLIRAYLFVSLWTSESELNSSY